MLTKEYRTFIVEVYDGPPSSEQIREVMIEAVDGEVERRMNISNYVKEGIRHWSYKGRDGYSYNYWIESHDILPVKMERGYL